MSNPDEPNDFKISKLIDSIATVEDQPAPKCFTNFVLAYVDYMTSVNVKPNEVDACNGRQMTTYPAKDVLEEEITGIMGQNSVKTEEIGESGQESEENEREILSNGDQCTVESYSRLSDSHSVLRSMLECPVPKPVSLVPKASEEQRSILPDRNSDSELSYLDVSRVKVETEDDVVPIVIEEEEDDVAESTERVIMSKLAVNRFEMKEKGDKTKEKTTIECEKEDDSSICGLEMETDENSEALPSIDFSKPGPSFGPVTRSSRTSRMTSEDENCTLELCVDEEVAEDTRSETSEAEYDEVMKGIEAAEEESEESENAEEEDETPTNLVLCRFCGRKVKSSELESHKQTHDGEPSFRCEVCDESFASEPRLASHFRRLHTGDHKCDLCEKTFSSKDGLKTHRKVHLDDRPYKCKLCEKAFKTRQSQYHHQKVHSDKKPYQCDLCGKKFKYKQLYKVHKEKVHENIIQTHTCSTCGKVYRNPQSLFRHQKHHSSDTRRHECDVCGRKFFEPHHLRKHHLIHDGIKPFECNVCQKSFRQKETLTHHLKVIHPLAGTLIPKKKVKQQQQSKLSKRPQSIQPKPAQMQRMPCVVVVSKAAADTAEKP